MSNYRDTDTNETPVFADDEIIGLDELSAHDRAGDEPIFNDRLRAMQQPTHETAPS